MPASDNGNSGVPSLSLVLIFKVLLEFFIWGRIPYFTFSLRKSIQSRVLTVFGSRSIQFDAPSQKIEVTGCEVRGPSSCQDSGLPGLCFWCCCSLGAPWAGPGLNFPSAFCSKVEV